MSLKRLLIASVLGVGYSSLLGGAPGGLHAIQAGATTDPERELRLQVEQDSAKLRLLLDEPVRFDLNGTTIGRESRERLTYLAPLLSSDIVEAVQIIGYADSMGDAENNLALGYRRATEVRRELTALGVGKDLLYAASAGEFAPASEYLDEPNRRVELEVEGNWSLLGQALLIHHKNQKAFRQYVEQVGAAPPRFEVADKQEGDLGWAGFGGGIEYPAYLGDMQDVSGMLQDPVLADGTKVQQTFQSDADEDKARAGCLGPAPAIIYGDPSARPSKMSVYSFLFMREHERAHHLLNHVRCKEATRKARFPKRAYGDEKKADCKAVEYFLGFTPGGATVLGAAGTEVFRWGHPKTPLYDGAADRANYIWHKCRN